MWPLCQGQGPPTTGEPQDRRHQAEGQAVEIFGDTRGTLGCTSAVVVVTEQRSHSRTLVLALPLAPAPGRPPPQTARRQSLPFEVSRMGVQRVCPLRACLTDVVAVHMVRRRHSTTWPTMRGGAQRGHRRRHGSRRSTTTTTTPTEQSIVSARRPRRVRTERTRRDDGQSGGPFCLPCSSPPRTPKTTATFVATAMTGATPCPSISPRYEAHSTTAQSCAAAKGTIKGPLYLAHPPTPHCPAPRCPLIPASVVRPEFPLPYPPVPPPCPRLCKTAARNSKKL